MRKKTRRAGRQALPFLVVKVTVRANRNPESCRTAEIQTRLRRLIHDEGRVTVAYGLNFVVAKVL